jgi:rifampin ADP-ribosylating transferase
MVPTHDHRLRLATGITTRCTEYGPPDGRPAVLLHSWAASRREFVRLVPLLPRALRVVTVDLRGHGDADKPAAGYDIGTLASDVIAAMDALDLPAAVLVGASSGGYVAQQVAIVNPDRVLGLVLAGSPRDLRHRPPFADDIDRLQDPLDEDWVRTFLGGFSDDPSIPRWYTDGLVADALRIPAAVWRATLAGLSASRPPTEVGRIDVPTLVVTGEDDALLSDQAEALADAIPRARHVSYPGTGHLVLTERPERLAGDIAAFLATLA